MTFNRYCSVCDEVVLSGRTFEYEYPKGSKNWKQEIGGCFLRGAGQCDGCGKYFCKEHNELSESLCPECLEEEESGYIPF